MDILVSQVGIDVSKDELVVCVDGGKPFVVRNDVQGCADLAGMLPPGCCVHLEASGSYERLARRMLLEAGFEVRLHNPLKVKRLVQARGATAKSDTIDARSMSQSGALLREAPVKSIERQGLSDVSRAIERLKQMAADLKRCIDFPELDPQARQAYEIAGKMLAQHASDLHKSLLARIKASSFREDFELLASVPAIGETTARVLLCELPEDARQRSGPQVCSYSALAPIDDSSGKREGRARLGKGNRRIKAALYMAAICAVRTQPWARGHYSRLRAKGRPHQAAIVAVMRRLLLRSHAVLKRGSAWQAEPPNT